MKKRTLILFFILGFMIFLFTSTSAEDVSSPSADSSGNEKVTSFIGILNERLSGEIYFLSNFSLLTKLLFGLEEGESITLQLFIFLILIWISLFILIQKILVIVPFFEGFKSWIGSLIMMGLIGFTGSIKSVANFFSNMADIFNKLDAYPIINLLIFIVLVLLFVFGFGLILRIFKGRREDEEAYEKGRSIARLGKIADEEAKTSRLLK